ncbi:flippase [Fictibacillus sp. WQ 8-8]|uniref:Flippase n=1 Tax=Fictibacillus marinisediminis TaxID=2878389 RepID=A0A9X1XJJ5_9BACL|nr:MULTISPECIES: flippase [Fictibacillus]MCK6258704.1 flippase [Fictibacillus marinisediminis]MCQ6264426.1 flippase [Fictibacillus sp. WQ 8-8]
MSDGNRSFVRNSFLTFSRQVTNIVIGILLLVVLARILGPAGQGKYALITLLPTVLLTFLTLGINTSTIYYISRGDVKLNTVYNNNIIIGTLLSLVSMGIGAIVIYFFSEKFFNHTPHTLLYLCLLALPFMFLREYFQTVFQGLQDFKLFNTAMVVNQVGILGFVAVFVLIFRLGLPGAIMAFIAGNLINVAYMVYQLKKKHRLRFNIRGFSWEYFRKSVNYGLKAHISNFASFLNYRIVVFLIGFFMVDSAVGIYVTAMNIGERLTIFAASISNVLYPKIAAIETDEERNHLTSLVSRNIMAITLVIALIGTIVAKDLIVTLFGHQYENSASLLQITLPGVALLSVEKILSNDIAGRGKPELNMYLSIFNVLFNLVLNVVLIPRYGVTGAAFSATITYFVSFLVKVVLYKKVTNEPYHRFLLIKKSDLRLYRTVIRKLKLRY